MARKNTRELVGATVVVKGNPGRLLLPDLIFRLVPAADARVEIEYLQAALAQPQTRAAISLLASGSAGSMPNISKGRLRTLEIAVPPIERQRTYAKWAERVDRARNQMLIHLAHLDALFASLRSRAFKGEL